MSRNLLLAAMALGSPTVSAQTVNTQVDGLVLTNGLTSLSETSGLNGDPVLSSAVTFLTDNDTTTFNFDIGSHRMSLADTGSIQGTFLGGVSGAATGVYIIGAGIGAPFNNNTPTLVNGTFLVQLALSGGLTSGLSYEDSDFVLTNQLVGTFTAYSNFDGVVVPDSINDVYTLTYAYLYIPFSAFGVTNGQVLGIRLSEFSDQFPDLSYIGAGYAGAPVPEPSSYGLALGGLALAVVAARRRAKK